MTNDILQDLIGRLNIAVTTLSDKITTLHNQNKELQQKITEFENDIHQLQLHNHTLQTQLEDAQKQIPLHMQQELDTIIRDVEKLHHTLSHYTSNTEKADNTTP